MRVILSKLVDLLLVATVGAVACTCEPGALVRAEVGTSSEMTIASPDRRLVVLVRAAPDDKTRARLFLQSRSSPSKTRLLCDYGRSGLVVWGPDSQSIIFIDYHSADDSRLRIFRIRGGQILALRDADAIVRGYASRPIRGREILSYALGLSRFDGPLLPVVEVHIRYMPDHKGTGPSVSIDESVGYNLFSGAVIRVTHAE